MCVCVFIYIYIYIYIYNCPLLVATLTFAALQLLPLLTHTLTPTCTHSFEACTPLALAVDHVLALGDHSPQQWRLYKRRVVGIDDEVCLSFTFGKLIEWIPFQRYVRFPLLPYLWKGQKQNQNVGHGEKGDDVGMELDGERGVALGELEPFPNSSCGYV